jgi:hypothetical protein
MTKTIVILFFIVITMLALAGSAFAKKAPVVLSPEQINLSVTRAVAGISALRSAMLDPDSFVLENVTVKAPNKQGVIDVCYTFRSHNRMGGYASSGTARLNSKDIIDMIVNEDMANSLFNPCFLDLQAHTLSIFTQVKAVLNAPSPTAQTPEEQAKQAQQYADCLKVAVNNPSIVCKQPAKGTNEKVACILPAFSAGGL